MLEPIARRRVLGGLASLPLAAVLADPRLARAAAAGLETVEITTAGGRTVSGALAVPESTPAPAVLLIHEWWGLNDQIKTMAAELAGEGYLALAADLYGGEVATTRERASALARGVEPAAARDTLAAWIAWLRGHDDSTGRVGTVGWCFGGGWSLNASIAAPVEATVIYYGRVGRPAEDLRALEGPVLGHFATEDRFIDEAMVGGFQREMAAAGRDLTVHWYVADHAFANPTGARYDAADAELAWSRTLAFFRRHLWEG